MPNLNIQDQSWTVVDDEEEDKGVADDAAAAFSISLSYARA
jgi:hypothetical protein